jgi:hypothetical protein
MTRACLPGIPANKGSGQKKETVRKPWRRNRSQLIHAQYSNVRRFFTPKKAALHRPSSDIVKPLTFS